MLAYVTIGAADLAASIRFYDATLSPLGYEKLEGDTYARFSIVGVADKENGPGTVHIHEAPAAEQSRPAYGVMPAFRASSPEAVRAFHDAALAAGGTDERAPGTRPHYTPDFYVAYVRDPAGNKLGVFCLLEGK